MKNALPLSDSLVHCHTSIISIEPNMSPYLFTIIEKFISHLDNYLAN